MYCDGEAATHAVQLPVPDGSPCRKLLLIFPFFMPLSLLLPPNVPICRTAVP